MKRIAFVVVVAVLAFHAGPFVDAQPGERIRLADKNVRIFPGKTADTCITAGDLGVYEVQRGVDRPKKLFNRNLVFTPEPIMDSSFSFLAMMVKSEGKYKLEILDIDNHTVKDFSLSDPPTAWDWMPNQEALIVATGKSLRRFNLTKSEVISYPHKYPGVIQSVNMDPTGERAVLTISMDDSHYTQTMLVDLNKKDKPRLVATYSYGSIWIDSKRIAYITGQGEPDSLVYIQQLDEEGSMIPVPQGRRQIAALGTPGKAHALSPSPQGDMVAILTRVFSPVDFFGEEASYYSDYVVSFKELKEKSKEEVCVQPLDIFSWSPKKNEYALVQKRIHDTPTYDFPQTIEAKVDYEILRSSNLEFVGDREYTEDESLDVTERPIERVCWTRDGSMMVAVEKGTGSNLWFFPVTP